MRYPASEKLEIIRIVEQSHLPARKTLGLIEALLVGIAKAQPKKTMASLKLLNELRASVVGRRMDLSTS
jgi:hypothetical protein|tara:strand:- start:2259 stop:2465 length:207 start_codon:yes stop_codon:yes gene_type:complete